MIELHDVVVSAGEFRVGPVSFTVDAGGWTTLTGPAGAGKTTLLEAIAGVRRVDGGRLLLRGRDLTHAAPDERGVGIVYQHGLLFPHLNATGNMTYGTRDSASATALAERFGAAPLAGRSVSTLSGGERQLVALVRALARQPDVLLLDEPFGALDPARRSATGIELQTLQRETGMTVLHVTHDRAEASALGSRHLAMQAGVVNERIETMRRARLVRRAADAEGEYLEVEVDGGLVRVPVQEGDAS